MGTIINYASERVTSVFTELRFALLPLGSRVPTSYTITAATAGTSVPGLAIATGSPVSKGDTAITLESAPASPIPAYSKITFANGVSVRTGAAATSGTAVALYQPAKAAIPEGITGSYTAGALTTGTEFLSVDPLPVQIFPGEVLFFDAASDNVRVIVSDYAPAGATVLEVQPTPAEITANETATTIATVYIAGATDASPSSAPKTVDTSNFLSGAGDEMVITGTSRTLNFSFQNIVGDPGAAAIKEILYNDQVFNREIYAILKRDAGDAQVAEQYEGACIPTQGDQASPVRDLVTITANLKFQGASFKYVPRSGEYSILTGSYTPPGLAV